MRTVLSASTPKASHTPRLTPGAKPGGADQQLAGQGIPLRGDHTGQGTAFPRHQALDLDAEPPGILARNGQRLFVGVIQRQASRSVQVIRPGTAHQLGHGAAALPQGGGHTVAGGIASADDNHIQPGGRREPPPPPLPN